MALSSHWIVMFKFRSCPFEKSSDEFDKKITPCSWRSEWLKIHHGLSMQHVHDLSAVFMSFFLFPCAQRCGLPGDQRRWSASCDRNSTGPWDGQFGFWVLCMPCTWSCLVTQIYHEIMEFILGCISLYCSEKSSHWLHDYHVFSVWNFYFWWRNYCYKLEDMKQSILSQIHLWRQGRCPPVPGRFASPFLEVTGVASERLVFMVQKKCWFVWIGFSLQPILSY